ncbi:carbamoyltransferase [Sediminibacterium sp.]|uniref:carbamoyltransferase family protein n=1 Tax=Sediminibacterium sp. TaxID=1917865 RepID=UPI002732C5E7|nr:carbamoyltransferase [Sediminibacterium sp.]MDP3392420.1 carbamoyltransferase [Sediminibacterium sp.]MDP3565686.1 carbamoyltransferase [Sediminibacterium sp.]
MQKILGISAFYHDSSAAIIIDGIVVAAAQEERFTRIKHTADFPAHSVRFCLETAGLSIDELDAVVFYDKPLLKFERLIETYFSFAPAGLLSFLKAMPIWMKEKIFLKKIIRDSLAEVGSYNNRKLTLLFTEHHLSHAASTYYVSPFDEAAILTIDGVGEWCTASICHGKGNELSMLTEMNFPHSVGLLYSAFTYFLGFKVNSGEYKLMGLAPYGNPDSTQTQAYVKTIKENLVDIKDDGSIWLNQSYFSYATGLRMVKDNLWNELFGFHRRDSKSELEQHHCNLALAIQLVTEEIVIKMAVEAKRLTGSDNLCIAGGVALNCVANGKLLRSEIFKEIYIQPASGDAGGAIGAALAAYYIYYRNVKLKTDSYDLMRGAYLGPEYSEKEIELMCRKNKAIFKKISETNKLCTIVAEKIAEGNVVGWFQGRMEFGPRALGNRSILGDPRNIDMQQRINIKIKYREGFRPFAPSVLEEDVYQFFEIENPSPYMLMVAPVKKEMRFDLPPDYMEKSLKEKLSFKRSRIQSVTHIDYSARIQTVNKETNPRYWQLLQSIKTITGFGMVVNTSFNVRGEPIVCTPHDAFRCFMSTDMDFLVINDYIFSKVEQTEWQNKEKWVLQFKED